jgi:hypothetical protein
MQTGHPLFRKPFADLLIAGALGGAAVLFWYFRLIVPATEMHAGSGDLYTQIYPMAHRATEILRSGHIPLWNPFQFCGQPFLASVLYGIFYPLNFPYFLFSTQAAIEAIAVEHVFLTGLFTYAYARAIDISRVGSTAAAIIFMFSGFVAAQALWFTPAIGAIAWVPLGFLAVEKLCDKPRPSAAALLAISVGMPVLAGWLQVWVYSIHAIGVYAVGRVLIESRRKRWQIVYSVLLLALGIGLGLALAAGQLLPSMELQALGPRRPGGLTVMQTLTLGPISPSRMLAGAVASDPGFPRQEYVGILPFLLLAASFFGPTRGRGRIVLLWLLLVLSVTIALTVYTPIFGLYRMLPGASWFRIPWRIVFVGAFAAAVLSGAGLDALVRLNNEASRRSRWGAMLVFVGVGVALLVFAEMPLRSRLYLAVGLPLVLAVPLVGFRPLRTLCVAGLIALLTGDLFLATRSPAIHPFHDMAPFDEEAQALDFVKAHQGFDRTYIYLPFPGYPSLMPKQGTLRGIFSITDYEPLSLDRYAKFYSLMDARKIPESDPARPPFIGFLNVEATASAVRLMNLLSVRFVVSLRMPGSLYSTLQDAGWQIAFTPTVGRFEVMENPDVLPRAYVAYNAIGVSEGVDALNVVAHSTFDPRTTVVVEGTDDIARVDGGGVPTTITPARIVTYQSADVVVEVDAKAAGYVVLTDLFYPGWRATVDGASVPMYQANYLFRAARIGPGHHTVELAYDPLSFRLGAIVSLAALSTLLAIAGSSVRKRLRRSTVRR